MKRLLPALTLAAAFCLYSGPVHAHAVLVGSTPENGARLAQAPPVVAVRFNEPVTAEFTPLQVQDRRGRRVDADDARFAPGQQSVITVGLKPLEPGFYTIIYRVTSLDGHPVQGTLGFAVGDAAGEAPVAAPTGEAGGPPVAASTLPPAVGLLHGLAQWAAVALVGLAAFSVLVPGSTVPSDRWAGGLSLALVALGVAEVGMYAVRASGEPFSPALLLHAFTRTRVGSLWLWRMGLTLVAGAALRVGNRYRWLALISGAGALLTFSLQSHAMATGATMPVVMDYIHLLAAAPWLGGLIAFAFLVRPMDTERVARFSKVAVTSVLLLTATGLYGSWLHIESLEALVSTAYGRTLLLKLGLFAVLLAVGTYNLVRRGGGAFRQAILAEVGLMLGVFVAAGFLTSMAPANVEIAMRRGPFVATARADGVGVTLRIAPNRIGLNKVTTGLEEDGRPLRGASAGIRAVMLDHDMGIQNLDGWERAPGEYQVDQLVLGMAGNWRIEVVVLTRQGREVRHAFHVDVPKPPG